MSNYSVVKREIQDKITSVYMYINNVNVSQYASVLPPTCTYRAALKRQRTVEGLITPLMA